MVFWTNDPDTSPALAARPLIRWVRDYYAATAPRSKEGPYINFMAANDQERGIQLRRPCERPIDIKKKYDAGNLYRVNQNIRVPDVREDVLVQRKCDS
jgi:hypothetical protein